MTKIKIVWLIALLILAGLATYYFYPEGKLPNNDEIDELFKAVKMETRIEIKP